MIKVNNLTCKYADKTILDNLSLDFKKGKVTALMGQSGIGKTTLLNAVAGLIKYEGEISGQGKISYCFQEPRLIDRLTVYKNLELVCEKATPSDILSVLTAVNLADKKDRYPYNLSVGEKQRVSLARAFLFGADTMLLDEPFTALDVKTKLEAEKLFKDLISKNLTTVIMVTHDILEAIYLADEVYILLDNDVAKIEINRAENGKLTHEEQGVLEDKIKRLIMGDNA